VISSEEHKYIFKFLVKQRVEEEKTDKINSLNNEYFLRALTFVASYGVDSLGGANEEKYQAKLIEKEEQKRIKKEKTDKIKSNKADTLKKAEGEKEGEGEGEEETKASPGKKQTLTGAKLDQMKTMTKEKSTIKTLKQKEEVARAVANMQMEE
jgi:hypothetical protein